MAGDCTPPLPFLLFSTSYSLQRHRRSPLRGGRDRCHRDCVSIQCPENPDPLSGRSLQSDQVAIEQVGCFAIDQSEPLTTVYAGPRAIGRRLSHVGGMLGATVCIRDHPLVGTSLDGGWRSGLTGFCLSGSYPANAPRVAINKAKAHAVVLTKAIIPIQTRAWSRSARSKRRSLQRLSCSLRAFLKTCPRLTTSTLLARASSLSVRHFIRSSNDEVAKTLGAIGVPSYCR